MSRALFTSIIFLFSVSLYGGDYGEFIVKPRISPLDFLFGNSFITGHSHNYIRSVGNGKMSLVYGTIEELQNDPNIIWVERNVKIHLDPSYKQIRDFPEEEKGSWGIEKIMAQKAWELGIRGKGIRVAVIDTGVDHTHPALAGKVLTDEGFNFITKTKDAMDDHSHGTHCSGTIAGNVIGVAPDAKIIPLKFLDAEGSGDLAAAVDAIAYATKIKVNIMSNSWGGGGYEKSLFEVIDEARSAGILFIAAAGNEYSDNDKTPAYPASYNLANVVSVAATDKEDKKAKFSNWGKKTVHVAAPGVKIYSSVLKGGYAEYSGTSMATPHVAGLAALLLSKGVSYKDVRKTMMDTGDKVEINTISGTRINAESAVKDDQ